MRLQICVIGLSVLLGFLWISLPYRRELSTASAAYIRFFLSGGGPRESVRLEAELNCKNSYYVGLSSTQICSFRPPTKISTPSASMCEYYNLSADEVWEFELCCNRPNRIVLFQDDRCVGVIDDGHLHEHVKRNNMVEDH